MVDQKAWRMGLKEGDEVAIGRGGTTHIYGKVTRAITKRVVVSGATPDGTPVEYGAFVRRSGAKVGESERIYRECIVPPDLARAYDANLEAQRVENEAWHDVRQRISSLPTRRGFQATVLVELAAITDMVVRIKPAGEV